ncbi:hypothetical protein [Nocardioides rubriscoriae]|uniref:hypothetical protein n=1 Tax=Nocardioides rubriscoriae TaxID=642762 RepID=UPI00147822A4|nr:hypothetical protein [Nocardioides rubriscoriae]
MSATSLRQTVLVTAVPRGVVQQRNGSRLRVGAHVSPRLSYAGDGGTLASFPDWVAWPEQSISWQVLVNGQALTPTVVSAAPDPALWRALFRPTLRVDSFTGDPGPARTVQGYSYAALAGYLRQAYVDPAGFGRSAFASAAVQALTRTRWQAGSDTAATVDEALEHYLGFWSPAAGGRTGGERGALDDDFHDRLTLVGDHAPLLERLGLVVVLDIPMITAPRESTVQVVPTWTPGSDVQTQVVTPRTQAVYDPAASAFVARRRSTTSSEHTELLHLATGSRVFSTHSLHVDAATAGNVGVAVGGSSDTGAAPTSGGLTLALAGRMRRVQDDLTAAEETARGTVADPAAPPDRYAEDLVVGHHVQVGVGPDQRWHGLGHRQVRYVVARDGQEPLEFTAVDEAAVTVAARQADPSDASTLLVSDVVMRWDGWSLAVPRPGVHLLQDDPANASVDAVQGRPPETPLTLETTLPVTSADGDDARLPVLRYGQTYAVRGRAVDVTGGYPAWDGAPSTSATTYWRYDPAPTPLVLPPPDESLTRGESARTVVVRSDPRSGVLPTVKSSRTLAPPRASVDTGLLHGWFDDAGAPDPAAYPLIGALDSATVPAVGPAPDGPTREPRARVVDWLPDPMLTDVRIGLLGADGTEVDGRSPGFLPPADPDGTGRASLGSWQSVALLVEGVATGAYPTISQAETATPHRIVTIGLPPARAARVALRALPHDETLALHGLVDWHDSDSFATTVAAVRAGQLPQLTPTTYVDMVHAVRQPLSDPVVHAPDVIVTRAQGTKDPRLLVPVDVHADSSARITLFASWTERIDDGPRLVAEGIVKPSLRTVPRTRVVEAIIDVDPTSPLRSLSLEGVVPLDDLRRRDLTLTAVATSRFVEEFRTQIPFKGTTGLLPVGVDPESVVVLGAGDRSPLTLDRDYRITAEGSAWRLTLVGLLGSAVVVEGVVGTVLATSAPSATKVVVPAAVRPTPPKVLYAVPAFAVAAPERDDGGDWHAGRGASRLRLYLERPWWSSGDGEQLAVIVRTSIDPSADPGGTAPTTRLTSLYGADPALDPGASPVLQQDLTSGTTVTGVLDELAVPVGATYTARVHDVLYDATRDLYYTEVQLRPQPAGTFVRLAVARYQPKVAKGLSNLSRIIAMDPVQLLPPRELTVSRRRITKQDVVVVAATGPSHRGPLSTSPPVLKVSLQVKAVRGAGDDLGWDTVSTATKRALANGKGFEKVMVVVPDVADGRHGDVRVLVEELETWLSEDERGEQTDPWPVGKQPRSYADAFRHLQNRRVTWVATTPMPR